MHVHAQRSLKSEFTEKRELTEKESSCTPANLHL